MTNSEQTKKQKKEPKSCPSFKTMCGGQALIEGILMRGPEKEAIVVRKPEGDLEVKVDTLNMVKTRHPVLGVPFIRGPVMFIDSMVHGVKALMYSAEFYPEEEDEKAKARKAAKEAKKAAKKAAAQPEAPQDAPPEPGPAEPEPAPETEAAPVETAGSPEPPPAPDTAAAPEPAPAEPSEAPAKEEKKGAGDAAMGIVVTFSVILGLGFSIVLFFILPTLLTGFLTRFIESRLLLSLIEGVVRMIIFLLYIILTSLVKDMKRVYRYHGAEHKTIFCYERGLELTVDNVRQMPRHHPRCGTSFLFVVMFVAILIHALLGFGWDNTWIRLGVRLLSLPFIVSITYEINRFVGRHDNWFTKILTAPGLWLQNFTTKEPDDSMIEVGIRALSEVLPQEKGADKW